MPPEQLEAGQEAGAARRHLRFHLRRDFRNLRSRVAGSLIRAAYSRGHK